MPPVLYGANLPSAGYEAPYQDDYSEMGDLPEAVYDKSVVTFGTQPNDGGFQVADAGELDEEKMAWYNACSDGGETVPVRYCPDCISVEELDAFACNLGAIFDYLENDAGYQACLYNKCGQHLGQEPTPIGAETPLLAFAFSYLAVRIYTTGKKKQKGG